MQKMLLFSLGKNQRFALPLSQLMRVDELHVEEIQTGGGREYVLFQNSVIPLIRIDRSIQGLCCDYGTHFMYAIIPRIGKAIGIAAAEIIDIIEIDGKIEPAFVDSKAIIGTRLIDGQVTSILDLCVLVELQEPGWFLLENREFSVKKKIILAEDSSFFRTVIGSYLRGIGLEVLCATNGKEALELLEKEAGAIDGVVSDLEMPVLDGFDLARSMKSGGKWSGIPRLAVSASEDPGIRFRALDAGFDDFFNKNDLLPIAEAMYGLIAKTKRG
jgi:two-component system, chemotaxis family, sensor kinase CheA